jgi:sialic acid synthase SpsE/RimJ/RimL family protein N-acetyltransferase
MPGPPAGGGDNCGAPMSRSMPRNESMLRIEICRPVEDDARQVMAWRNDPDTLAVSFHRQAKTWEEFWPEFQGTYFSDPGLPPLFVLDGNDRVGFLRFRPARHPRGLAGRTVDVSINLAPDRRGDGLGAPALASGLEFAAAAGVDGVLAEVRLENEVSHKVFEKAEFERVDEAVHVVADTGEEVSVARYVYELTPPFWRRNGVFVIAEAGSNWRVGSAAGDAAMGRALIDAAVDAGADAVKFQTYRAETVYVANAGSSDYLSEAGNRDDIGDIFSDLAMPYEMVGDLAEYAAKHGIGFMSAPFSADDFAAVDPFVEVHKIASYEISHPHLLTLAGQSGKPLVLSTGASGEDDIAWAVDTFRAAGGRDLCLLQCTARYPAPPDSLNLAVLPWLKRRFGVAVGFSDHSRHPLHGPMAAVALGARVIEKHFTMDNTLPGPDHAFALEPDELKQMVDGIRGAEVTLGDGTKRVLGVEEELADYARRGLQALRPIAVGEILREGDAFAVLRPGKRRLGLHARHRDRIEGRKAIRAVAAGDGLREGDWLD